MPRTDFTRRVPSQRVFETQEAFEACGFKRRHGSASIFDSFVCGVHQRAHTLEESHIQCVNQARVLNPKHLNPMPIFNENIADRARKNTNFRQEILTNEQSQVVLMSVQPGDDIGEETHTVDQILVFVAGSGEAVLNGQKSSVGQGSLVAVPKGTLHNFINTGSEAMKLFTIYAPPEEEIGTLHRDKAEAEAAEAEKEKK